MPVPPEMATIGLDMIEPPVEITKVLGRMPYASNATLLGEDAHSRLWVYKPDRGESPLWDFTLGTLSTREVLAYEVNQAMGLDLIPPTFEATGVYGPGSAQAFLEEDTEFDPRPWFEDPIEPTLWPFAVFDVITNNADRKVGHLLKEVGTERVWGIDNGLTFHPIDKLRTVLWGFAGQPVPDELIEATRRLGAAIDGELGDRICRMLGEMELDALAARIALLVETKTHPLPPVDRPAVPWPMW